MGDCCYVVSPHSLDIIRVCVVFTDENDSAECQCEGDNFGVSPALEGCPMPICHEEKVMVVFCQPPPPPPPPNQQAEEFDC